MVTDGGFRPDGTFVHLPAHSAEVLTEAFRHGVLKLFVGRELFEPAVADVMRTDAELPPGGVTIESKDVSLADAQRRWADLLRRIYEVDPLLCPKCGSAMRVIALIQESKVIDKILRHLRAKGRSDGRAHGGATALETRMGRWTRGWEGLRLPGYGGGAIEIPILLAPIVVMALFLTNALDRSSLAVYLLRALKERDRRGR